MSDREFTIEVRRAVIIIMRACVRRFGMAWLDFMPREDNTIIERLAQNQSATVYLDVAEVRPGS